MILSLTYTQGRLSSVSLQSSKLFILLERFKVLRPVEELPEDEPEEERPKEEEKEENQPVLERDTEKEAEKRYLSP